MLACNVTCVCIYMYIQAKTIGNYLYSHIYNMCVYPCVYFCVSLPALGFPSNAGINVECRSSCHEISIIFMVIYAYMCVWLSFFVPTCVYALNA